MDDFKEISKEMNAKKKKKQKILILEFALIDRRGATVKMVMDSSCQSSEKSGEFIKIAKRRCVFTT